MLLMHKDTPVAKMQMMGSKPIGYEQIFDAEKLPVGTMSDNKEQEHILFNHWYKSRAIPHLRPNISDIEAKLGKSRAEAFFASAGVSLTDLFWFKKENDSITWDKVNFHSNGFEPVLAKACLDNLFQFSPSPDFTTDGIMEKFWLPIAGKPYLFKVDRLYSNLLSANEIVFYKIADEMEIKTTPYFSGAYNDLLYCMCPCFVKTDNCDFINAMQIKHQNFSRTSDKLMSYFIKDLGFDKEIKQMLTLDCLFHNTDRHEKNFGFIQFEDGSQMFAPLYDNGYCLGLNRPLSQPISNNDMRILYDSRDKILDIYGCVLSLDRNYCLRILENTYQEFQIPEDRFEVAKEELEYGMHLIEKHNLCYYTIPPASQNQHILTKSKEDNDNAHDR